MTRKIMALFFLIVFGLFGSTSNVLAQKNDCDDRYLTLINPVRGRNLWPDNSLKPLEDQHGIIASHNFSATWLLQYDALTDEEIIGFVKDNFSSNQEIGLFLEVSPDLARFARVVYPHLVAWFDPQAVFLSAYSQGERRRLIDAVFRKFNEVFGYYPVSVGAWWIDSYSLEYIKNKYSVKTVLIVADQKTTDDYGVWGQWWGVAYYPSKANILTPAQEEKTKQDVVVLQWAQRDISKASGEGTSYSNYSLQANDYTERRLETSYFKQLINNYLDCSLPIGQVTVGLETGMESVKSFSEYKNQLEALTEIEGLQDVTMDEFSNHHRDIYHSNPEKLVLKDDQSEWVLTPQERENRYLKEKTTYQENLAFADYFIPDKSDYLNRKLPINHSKNDCFVHPFFGVFAFILGFILYRRNNLTKHYWPVSIFILASFLTTFLSYSKFGWCIYFGPVFKNIPIIQFVLVMTSYFFFILILKFFTKKIKNIKLLVFFMSLSFAVDFVIGALRYTYLNGQRYFGFAWDSLRFIGFKVSPESLAVVNQDFSSVIAGALLKFDFNIIWESQVIALIIYPLSHVVLGGFAYMLCIKLPKRLRQVVLVLLSILFCLYLLKTITLDPREIL